MRAALIALLLVLGAPTGAFESGNDLLPYCKKGLALKDGAQLSTEDAHQGLMCLAYIKGLVDGHTFFANLELVKGREKISGPSVPLFCPPSPSGEVDVTQMTRVVVRDLEQRSEALHIQPTIQIFGALKRAFPCRK